ncbi:MAG: hypothetical protein ABIA74_03875 [bacterium]
MFFHRVKAYLVIFLLLFSSCAHEPSTRKKSLSKLNSTTVLIDMPKNRLVFENISPIIYKAFYDHFVRVGFNLDEKNNPKFILKIEVKKLDAFGKIISPDILSYGFNLKLELACSLFNENNKLIKEKEFQVSTAVFKPRDPILNSNFYTVSYKKLAYRAAIKVEQYFRKYFLTYETDQI